MAAFTTDPTKEFQKLDVLDKRLFFEILEKYPSELEPWIDDLTRSYAAKAVPIDSFKFKVEARDFIEFLKKEDSAE